MNRTLRIASGREREEPSLAGEEIDFDKNLIYFKYYFYFTRLEQTQAHVKRKISIF